MAKRPYPMKRTLTLTIFIVLQSLVYIYAQNNLSANSPVIANGDFGRTYKMVPVEINITNNDYGIGSGVSSVEITKHATNGSVTITKQHTLIYTPNDFYVGTDTINYRICNNYDYCGVAMVRIIVEDYDYAPLALNDTVVSYETKNFTIDPLANDQYLYDLPLSMEIITNFNNSIATINKDLEIVPNINKYFTESDSLLYQVCDKHGDCHQAWVFISLNQEVEQKIFIPQGFSPNGDGINDTFTIPDFENVQDISIYIYNRRGNLLYEDNKYNNNWDGYANKGDYKGQLLESGTYYYLMKVNGIGDFKGFIYLSR